MSKVTMSKVTLKANQMVESPIGSQFVSNCNFVAGSHECVGQSTVKKAGNNKGKTLLRFQHESSTNFSMGCGDYRVACEAVGADAFDGTGNVLPQTSECPSGKFAVIV